jgi:DHA1 family bicyclomycin/chloramphenicol resistance-like MFS transporter
LTTQAQSKKNRVIRSGDDLTKRQRLIFILLLGTSMTLMPYSIDPILPSFPSIGAFFGVADSAIQFSLTGVTIGFALGQLLTGPLSDALGRRRPMQVAVLLYVLATVGSAFATNIETFFTARLLMGVGAAAATVVASAVIRDLYVGLPMMKLLSRVFLIQGLAPVFGPLMGSQLLAFLTWQQILLLFAAYGFLAFIGIRVFLVETLHTDNRKSSGVKGMAHRFRSVLRDRIYVGLIIFSALQTVALFAYLNITPFLFQDSFKLTAGQFGLFFALNSLFSTIGVQVGAWVLFAHAGFAGLGGVALVVAGLSGAEFWLVTALCAFVMFNFGGTLTPLQSIALAPHGSEAGTAASLLGVLNFVSASLAAPLYSVLETANSVAMGATIASCYGLGLASLWFIVRLKTVPALKA